MLASSASCPEARTAASALPLNGGGGGGGASFRRVGVAGSISLACALELPSSLAGGAGP